ncbi:MAG: glycosyltransferase family 39 protein [Candidatus Aenigmatarchaeota archaeon]
MSFTEFVKRRYELIILLVFLLVVFILELRVTIHSPIAFGDEGHHTRMAQWIAENKEYPVYVPIEGTKLIQSNYARPPLWHLLQGGFYTIFGFSEIIVKVLTPFIVSITGLATYLLVKRIFDEKSGIIASIITVTFPAVVTYAVLFYVDSLLTLYFSLFVFLLLLGIKEENKRYLFLAGTFGAFSFLTKLIGVFVLFIEGLTFVYGVTKLKSNFRQMIKIYALPLFVTLLFILPFLLRNTAFYNTPLCTTLLPFDVSKCDINEYTPKYQFSQAIEQVGTNVGLIRFGLTDYLRFAYGNIWFVGISIVGGLFLLKRYEGIKIFVIGFTILGFLVLFIKLLNVRAEDVARYTLSWSPVIATVMAVYLSELYSFLEQRQKYLGIVIILLVIFFSYTSLTQKLDVMKTVKKFSPLFFEACDWVKENLPKDSIISTVWGHHTTYNCQRMAAGNLADFQLSNDPEFIVKSAKENGITHIFVQKFSIRNQPLQEGYTIDFVKLLENNPDKFKKVYENGPDLNSCLSRGGCDGNIIYEII